MDKNSFVFYESFWKVTSGFDDVKFSRLMRALIQYSLYGTAPDLPDETENALVTMMTVNVDAAHERYAKAKEDGAKGGRPKKWIDRAEAEKLFSELGNWKSVADKMGVNEDTLRKARYTWEHEAEKPKNLTVTDTDTDTDTVTVTDTDTVTSILINNNSRSRRGASEAPSLPALKEGERWVTEPYVRPDGKVMADYKDASGEVRSMFIG